MIKIQFASKKEHAQTFAQIIPSGNLPKLNLSLPNLPKVELNEGSQQAKRPLFGG